MKKFQSIINKFSYIFGILILIILWFIISKLNFVPKFLLPSPIDVIKAFFKDFNLILSHLLVTLLEAFTGLSFSIILGFFLAIIMDKFNFIYKITYPILVLSQTIPTIAIAPLIVLWFGFGIFPKIVLIFITCFFPITISILSGFKSIDNDMLKLMKSLNSSYLKTLFFLKIPYSLKSFFSGLKISASYSIVSAVVAEWLGGEKGIGVYMTRVKKAYAFDKMFASIIIISIVSIILVYLIKLIENYAIYWEKNENKGE